MEFTIYSIGEKNVPVEFIIFQVKKIRLFCAQIYLKKCINVYSKYLVGH